MLVLEDLLHPFVRKLFFAFGKSYVTFEIRKPMLDMPVPCSFRNIGPPVRPRPCENMWLKLGQHRRSPINNQFTQSNSSSNADKNGQGTMMI